MGEIIDPTKKQNGEPIKPMPLGEVLGKKSDMMSKLTEEKKNGNNGKR